MIYRNVYMTLSMTAKNLDMDDGSNVQRDFVKAIKEILQEYF